MRWVGGQLGARAARRWRRGVPGIAERGGDGRARRSIRTRASWAARRHRGDEAVPGYV